MEQLLYERVRQNLTSGIWARSLSARYFVFCVGQSIHKQKAFIAFAYTSGIGIKPLFGSYKGQAEQSFIADMKDYDQIEPWLEAEESILLIGSCNSENQPTATLRYLATGEDVPIGRMVPVRREEALSQDSWTYDPFQKVYFTCKW